MIWLAWDNWDSTNFRICTFELLALRGDEGLALFELNAQSYQHHKPAFVLLGGLFILEDLVNWSFRYWTWERDEGLDGALHTWRVTHMHIDEQEGGRVWERESRPWKLVGGKAMKSF